MSKPDDEPHVSIRLGTPASPVLDAFRTDRSRVSAIMGPLGSGKTYAAIVKLLKIMSEQEPNKDGVRPTRFVAVRNTFPDLASTTMKDFQEVFTPKLGNMKMGGLEPPTFYVNATLMDGTHIRSEVIFLALDRVDSVKKIRGLQITGAWLNEMKELVKPVVDMLDLRHGRYPTRAAGGVQCSWHGMIGDTNACDEDHWYYQLAEEDHPEDWKFFRQPGGVFPTGEKDHNGREIFIPNEKAENLHNLPEGYYVRGMQAKSDDWIRVNLGNEYGFVSEGKPVHPQYVDSIHTAPEPIPYNPVLPILLGIDFGRTPAAAIGQRDTQWDRFSIIDEFVAEDMSQALFAPNLRRYLNANYPGASVRAWCDPAGDGGNDATEQTAIQVLNAAGIPARATDTNNPTVRRAAIANPCMRMCGDGRPAFMVSPKAKMIRKGLMGGYCYRRMKVAGDEKYTEQPDKNSYSHPVEAAEYLCQGEGEGRAALKRPQDRNQAPRQTHAVM